VVYVVSLEANLDNMVQKAADFHGHMGPFLVVGVRMGIVGLQKLGVRRGDDSLSATVFVEPSVPFSCAIDGIQVTTKCTIGNGKLRLRNSTKEISTVFEVSGGKQVTVTLNPVMLTELKRSLRKIAASEKLEEIAGVVASVPDQELFLIQQ